MDFDNLRYQLKLILKCISINIRKIRKRSNYNPQGICIHILGTWAYKSFGFRQWAGLFGQEIGQLQSV
jgi:hypothetical protein